METPAGSRWRELRQPPKKAGVVAGNAVLRRRGRAQGRRDGVLLPWSKRTTCNGAAGWDVAVGDGRGVGPWRSTDGVSPYELSGDPSGPRRLVRRKAENAAGQHDGRGPCRGRRS